MSPEKLKQLEEFEGDEELAAEYSVHKTCKMSDGGYHCSCYDVKPTVTDTGYKYGGICDICEEENPEFAAKRP